MILLSLHERVVGTENLGGDGVDAFRFEGRDDSFGGRDAVRLFCPVEEGIREFVELRRDELSEFDAFFEPAGRPGESARASRSM